MDLKVITKEREEKEATVIAKRKSTYLKRKAAEYKLWEKELQLREKETKKE